MLKFVVIAFLVWRILLFIPLFAGDKFLEYRARYEYTNIWKFTEKVQPLENPLIYPWSNFDGVHYLSIAGQGYRDNERFFPMYPLLIKFLSGNAPAFSATQFFTALVIGNVAFLGALILLYKLLRLDYNANIVRTTIIATLLFPTSFFFASIYSESLFLLLAVCSFYFARKKNWFLSSASSGLLALTRIVGIAILPALFFEKRKISHLILPTLAILVFLLYNFYQFGNAFQFLVSQQELANSRTLFVFPLQTVYRYLNILLTTNPAQYEWGLAFFEITTFIVVSVLLYIAWKKKVRTSYLIFALAAFAIPVFSGTFSGLPRYAIILFPIFIAFALIRNRIVKTTYLIISPVLLFILLMLFSRGYFIG